MTLHPIYLIGPRGTGKTTVGRLLAARLGREFLDADTVLEAKHGKRIADIFRDEGEADFRAKESAVLEGLSRSSRHVIATGGGVVLRPENRARLRRGRVVWLTADADTLWRRLQADPTTPARRPDLAGGGSAEIERVLAYRRPLYSACADGVVPTADLSPEAVVEKILTMGLI